MKYEIYFQYPSSSLRPGFVFRSSSFSIFSLFFFLFSFQFYSLAFFRIPYSVLVSYPSDPYSVYLHYLALFSVLAPSLFFLTFLCPSSFFNDSLFSLSQLRLYPFSLFSVLAPSLSFLSFFLFVPVFLIYSLINPGSISPSRLNQPLSLSGFSGVSKPLLRANVQLCSLYGQVTIGL